MFLPAVSQAVLSGRATDGLGARGESADEKTRPHAEHFGVCTRQNQTAKSQILVDIRKIRSHINSFRRRQQ